MTKVVPNDVPGSRPGLLVPIPQEPCHGLKATGVTAMDSFCPRSTPIAARR